MSNKKGSERILSIWNLVIWIMVGLAFVIGIYAFNNVKTDARAIEADLLALKLINCVVDYPTLNPNFLVDFGSDEKAREFLKRECKLVDSGNVDNGLRGKLFAKVKITKVSGGFERNFYYGDNSKELDCNMQIEGVSPCFTKTFHAKHNNEDYEVEIKSLSNNLGDG
ncbi:MAG: hypothetical protein KKF56_03980 [Nanoarchaeota archaeon]|nr:hypothetical protein [Nanoarchaeota archaeon]